MDVKQTPSSFYVPHSLWMTPMNLTRSRESWKRRLKPWIAPIHFLWSSTFLSKGDNAFCLLLNRVMMNFGSPHLLFEFLYEKNQYFILYDVTRLRLYGTHYPGLWGFLRSNCYIPPACGACWGIKNSILGNLFSHVWWAQSRHKYFRFSENRRNSGISIKRKIR